MRHILLILFISCSACAGAQTKKSFFDRFYFSAWFGNLDYNTDQTKWKNIYADRSSIPYLLDTMKQAFQSREWFIISINAKGAASLSVSKRLTNDEKKFWRKRELEWRTGINFKTARHIPSRDGYMDYFNYQADTTKIHYKNFVRLKQNQQIIEWQNLLNFKTGGFPFRGTRFVIGNGLGISRTITNTIHESLSVTSYTWDTARHYLVQKQFANTENEFKAKPETSFSYILYLATEYKLGPQVTIAFDFNYTLSHYRYSAKHLRKEGYWLGITFGYSFDNTQDNKKR